MAHLTADRVLQVVTPVSTTSFTLGTAITGFRGVAAIPSIANSDTVFYAAWAVDANGTPTGEWENGVGTYVSAGGSLTRTTIISSSNSNSAVTFTGSPVWLSVTLLASKTAYFDKDHAMFMPTATAEPPIPTGGIELYAKELLPQHTVLKVMRPSGVDSPIQDAIAFNRFIKYQGGPSPITAIGGGALTVAGTGSAVTSSYATDDPKSNVARTQYQTAATANSIASLYAPNLTSGTVVARGVGNGSGGFRYVVRFNAQTLTTNMRIFVGLHDIQSAPTNIDPLTSTTPGKIGIALNRTTSQNWEIVHNVSGTAPTRIGLGASFAVNADLIELILFCRPHNGTSAGDVTYRVRRYATSAAPTAEASGTLSTNIPAGNTRLVPALWVVNVDASAANIQVNLITLESDF